MLDPLPSEITQRDGILARIVEAVAESRTIRLPAVDRGCSQGAPSALVGIEENEFGGRIGPYRYQFEGEEDLLHLIVTRLDLGSLTPEEGQDVARFVLPRVPPGLVWLKPGTLSQHFYVGHDDLVMSFHDTG